MATPRSTRVARSLRRIETPQEQRLWKALRGRKLQGLKFRRQEPIHGYVVDFLCYERRLAVELDGAPHREGEQQEYDRFRDQVLADHGLTVLRIANEEIEADVERVLVRIAQAATGSPDREA